MKNCVYYTLYGNEKYGELLELSLISLNKYFNKEHIYVFSDIDIKKFNKYCNVIEHKFPTGFAKPMAERYKIIKILSQKYENMLQLDCDTLCLSSIDEIFKKIKNNKILIATEFPQFSERKKYLNFETYKKFSKRFSTGEHWAGPLLNEQEKKKYAEILSICAGIFACNVSFVDHAEKLSIYINSLEDSGFFSSCGDQHGFVKYILENNLYDFSLQEFVCHGGFNIINNGETQKLFENKINLVHFAGGVVPSEAKKKNMKELLRISYGRDT